MDGENSSPIPSRNRDRFHDGRRRRPALVPPRRPAAARPPLRPRQNRNDHGNDGRRFVSAAMSALSAGSPITRLTFRVDAVSSDTIWNFLYLDSRDSDDVVGDVLSHPAARGVEEVRLAAGGYSGSIVPMDGEVISLRMAFHGRSFLHLLPETLHVLDVTGGYNLEPPAAGVAFPRLASLRLRLCMFPLDRLQGVIDAALALAIVHLESVTIQGKNGYFTSSAAEEGMLRLHCPAATALVLEKCRWGEEACEHRGSTAVEIDAPRLRRFTYKGLLWRLSLSSPAPDLSRVHLHFSRRIDHRSSSDEDPYTLRVRFWRSLHTFSNAKQLKLRVSCLEDIAVVDDGAAEERAELLPRHAFRFRNLERLELEGGHRPKGKAAPVAIADLLRCCPVVRDLRIKLTMVKGDSFSCLSVRKHRHGLHKSIHGFKRCRLGRILSLEADDDDEYDEVSDIIGLSLRFFHCLRSTLTRVSLQFRTEMTDCFGVRLIEFLERWVAYASKMRRNTSFILLPLER